MQYNNQPSARDETKRPPRRMREFSHEARKGRGNASDNYKEGLDFRSEVSVRQKNVIAT